MREQNRQEIIEFFLSGIIRMLLSHMKSCFYSGSRTMMSVCYVDLIDTGKRILNCPDIVCIINDPYIMCNTIRGSKAIQLLSCLYPVNDLIYDINRTIGKEDWSGLRTAGFYMADTILFFVFSGVLMFLDHIIHIVIDRCTGNQTCLMTSIHDQFIYVVNRLFFFDISAILHHLMQKIPCLLIYFRCIGIYTVIK